MTAGAIARKAIGVVIDGRCRDISEHREAGFAVFARGQSTVGQGGHTRPSELDVPITVTPIGTPGYDFGMVHGEAFLPVNIQPGDVILGDVDGVVCVPVGIVDEVIEKCRVGREIDEKCMADIRAGKGVAASFKLHRGK
jgi:regulator of RNase E activity RraA